jgi:hypothetical protein
MNEVRQGLARELECHHIIGRTVKLRDKGKVVMMPRPFSSVLGRKQGAVAYAARNVSHSKS